MRVVITGGAGFIGSHIVDAVLTQGGEPIVLDDFSTGTRGNVADGVETINVDISASSAAEMIARLQPDAVIHTAAQASVRRSMADPARDRAINLVGTEHVINGAREGGARRFVFLSTGGGIYGETEAAATESTMPRPKSFYSVHKYAAEQYVEFSGMPHAIARLANVYGPRQGSHLEGGVVAIFAERLAQGKPITIHGTGEQRRDFVHVQDVSAAIMQMLTSDLDGLWNVSTGAATTINSLLQKMEDAIAPAISVHREPARAGDVFSSLLSSARIATDLKWQPVYSLEAGIATIVTRATDQDGE